MHRNSHSPQCGNQPMPSVKALLRELAALAGQEEVDGAPVLELQIGDVVSRTTVESIGNADYLTINAWLPPSERSAYLSGGSGRPSAVRTPSDASIAWNPEQRRYVVTRRVPTQELQDDRSVMDAILLTVDDGIAWLDLIRKLDLQQPVRDNAFQPKSSAR